MTTLTKELSQILPAFDDFALQDGEQQIESLLGSALEEPIDHPKLTESIFPGDSVAILVQNGLPSAREMLESLLKILERSRIETENILVVLPAKMMRQFDLVELSPADAKTGTPQIWRMQNDERGESALRFEIHDADDENSASYLAANEQGNPVYVNRSLCDSDVVLPLSCISPSNKESDCLYPEFSTDETRARFRKKQDTLQQRIAEAELANDSLGLFFSIEMVCRPGEIIDHIVCGSRTQTRRVVSDRLSRLWQMEPQSDCDVVVTTVESVGEHASWENIVRAVRTAAVMVVDGPIVVWSQLSGKPSKEVKAACSAQFEGSVPDSLPANLQHFASILCDRPVYLKSQLSQNFIEGLGLGHIESIESAQRILGAFSQPFLIRDGHLRVPETEPVILD